MGCDDLSSFITSTIADFSPESLKSFDPRYPIGTCQFKPGERYGPFFKASFEDINRFLEVTPAEKNFAGFKEPHTKEEARTWYKPLATNPLSHVHEFYVDGIPEGEMNAFGFVGKITDGTEFQILFNHIAVKYIVRHRIKELS